MQFINLPVNIVGKSLLRMETRIGSIVATIATSKIDFGGMN